MSYSLIHRGLGATATSQIAQSYVTGGVPASVDTANRLATDKALTALKVSADYAGPIRQGEQAIFNDIMGAIQNGTMPDGGAIAMTLTQTGAAVGATAACTATPIAPAAPLCGAVAAKLVGGIANLFSGGSGCATKISGVCAGDVYNNYKAASLKECADGDALCRAAVGMTIDSWRNDWEKALSNPVAWSASSKRLHGIPLTTSETFASLSYDVAMKKVGDFPRLGKKILPITMKSRVNAELAFMDTIEAQAKVLEGPYVKACPAGDPGCLKITRGLMGEAAYESAMALRGPGGTQAAARVLQNAHLQADGALTNALAGKRAQDALTQEALDRLEANDLARMNASSQAGLNALDSQTRRRVAVGVVTATLVGAFAILRYRKRI